MVRQSSSISISGTTYDKDDAAKVEEVNATLDLYDEKYFLSLQTDEQIQRTKELEDKHRAFYWTKMKKAKGPQPSPSEAEEYRQSLKMRLKVAGPARRRLFLCEISEEDLDRCWGMIERAYADINTYQYAWIGMIMANLKQKNEGLEALRILLLYASTLLTMTKYQNPRKALKVLKVSERAIVQLLDTMSAETGHERWLLSFHEYNQHLLTAIAFACLNIREHAVEFFIEAAEHEQQHRAQAMLEYCNLGEVEVQMFEDHASALQIVSEGLQISRRYLDVSYSVERLQDSLFPTYQPDEAELLWECLQTFEFVNPGKSEPPEFCEYCWMVSPSLKNLKKCSRCKQVAYCSKECQLNDWKEHKLDCLEDEESWLPVSSRQRRMKTLDENHQLVPWSIADNRIY